ncbi:MAG: DUF1501 domain-containing protein [Planctomycetia bacterium]|nr:DUF1501 domain-containing protein [Planctomycetia bacterium]
MHREGCHRPDHPAIGRRELLHVGGLGLLGTGLADLLRLESQAAAATASPVRAKSVVFVFQSGGPSQFETFDPKPDAPAEIRGEYGTIATKLPGIRFCEYLPRLAARSDKFSIVRTMHHTADRSVRSEHAGGHYLIQTGTTELPPGDTLQTIASPRQGRAIWPSIGSMIAYAAPPSAAVGWPAVVEIPREKGVTKYGRDPGLLGPRFARWTVDLAPTCNSKDPGGSCPNCFSHDTPNDPARAPGPGPNAWWDNSSCRNPDFHLPQFGAKEAISIPQLSGRVELVRYLDSLRRSADVFAATPESTTWDAYSKQAQRLVLASHPGKQNPFDLSQETDAVRDLYGREEWGQALLVARRLVESGVRMVQVNLRGWDTHQNAFRDLKGHLLPSLDLCLSGFLDDLAQRGMLDETLIVMCGEMGRTPRVSPIVVGGKNVAGDIFTPGRHHWGDVFPCLVAGGGTVGGRIIGQTDKHGGQPVGEAYTPADLAATIFRQLGIGPEREFHDAQGRAYAIYRGQPIAALM